MLLCKHGLNRRAVVFLHQLLPCLQSGCQFRVLVCHYSLDCVVVQVGLFVSSALAVSTATALAAVSVTGAPSFFGVRSSTVFGASPDKMTYFIISKIPGRKQCFNYQSYSLQYTHTRHKNQSYAINNKHTPMSQNMANYYNIHKN